MTKKNKKQKAEDIPKMKLITLQKMFRENKLKPGAAARTFSKSYNMFMNYQFQPCIEAMTFHMHDNIFLKPYTDLPECNKLGLCSSTPGYTFKVEKYETKVKCDINEGFKKGDMCVFCDVHDQADGLQAPISDIVSDWCMPEFVSRSVEKTLTLSSNESTPNPAPTPVTKK